MATSKPPVPATAPGPTTATPATLPGTAITIQSFTSPFRRITQAERMDDALACIAMLVHQPLSAVQEAAYGLGYPRHGPALASETMIAKLLMQLGQLAASKYLDFVSWDALPRVALVYVNYDEDMEIGRHVLYHHVPGSAQQPALSYAIEAGPWLPPEQAIVTDFSHYDPGWYIEVKPAGVRPAAIQATGTAKR